MSKVSKILSRTKESEESQPERTLTSQTGSSQPRPKMAILKRGEPGPAQSLPKDSKSEEKRTTSKTTERKPQVILQRAGTPSELLSERERTGSVPGSGGAPMSLYDILKGYEFPYETAIPLIHNDMNFNMDTKFLKPLRSTLDYLVITAIGPPGSGKTTVLNYLANKSGNAEFNTTSSPVFLPRKEKDEEKLSNFYISEGNIIFIEMASIFNGSAAVDLIPMVDKFSTLESMTMNWNLRLMRWALSVSHMVLILTPTVIDPKIFQLIHSASTLHPMESAFGDNCHPELLFIANKCKLNTKAEEQLISICNTADVLGFGRRARVRPNAFMLPHSKYCDVNFSEDGTKGYKDFRRKVYEYNQWTRTSFSDDDIDGELKIPQALSFGDWLSFASNLWDDMGYASYFHDYVKLLQ